MKFKHLFFIILLFPLSFQIKAQQNIESFTPDSIAFFKEMSGFLEGARKDEAKDFMKKFEKTWYGGKFSQNQRQGVYNICDKMLANRMHAFPDFVNYLNTVNSFVKSKYQTPASFDKWQKILGKLIVRKGRHAHKVFADYLTVCSDLFDYNMMYSSASTQWAASNSHYTFGYDSLPKMTFSTTDITCYSKQDSIKIYGTQGVYYPTTNMWIGEGGKVEWNRSGYSSDSVYAELKNYKIAMRYSHYDADSVTFYNKYFFPKPLEGRLEDKVRASVTEKNASYPRFFSYNKRIEIKNISDSVDYEGGFAMQGTRVLGAGDKQTSSELKFYRNKKLFLVAKAQAFAITPTIIRSNFCSVTFYLYYKDSVTHKMIKDSIYHPGLDFKFQVKKRIVTLFRDGKGMAKAPYTDTYHKINMDFEQLVWRMSDPKIHFTHITTKNTALFTSVDYFDRDQYDALQGISQVHPLIKIKDLYQKTKKRTMTLMQLAVQMHYTLNETELFLIKLSHLGYVNYDFDKKQFTLKDKLMHDIYARVGKVDYDDIRFFSNPIKSPDNATLNLIDNSLKLYGVKQVLLSDSQRVVVIPKNEQLTIYRNRNFKYDGILGAGKFEFYGTGYEFKYKQFKINLNHVDSLRLFADGPKKDKFGRPIWVPVKTVLQNIRGDLLIDNPSNKSGFKPYKQYPIFNSEANSYVFYDSKNVQNGVYKRDKFYFQIYPFTIDSLANFKNSQLKFKGKFASAGIFPDFEETLVLQPDYSLGFTKKTPPDGMPLYGNKGRYYSDINLSNRGLKGNGKLTYLTSTTFSKNFYFFPDSVRAKAELFDIKAQASGVEYPRAHGADVDIKWMPYKDTLTTKTLKIPLAMYDGSTLAGKTELSPGGLTGSGKFSFETAELTSNLYKFKYQTIKADTANFYLRDKDSTGLLNFATTNMNTFIDFKNRFGDFKSNGGGSVIKFIENQYIAYMQEFKWFMDSHNIELSGKQKTTANAAGVKLSGSQFISVNPKQDSLSFYSSKAIYDVNKHIIHAKEVKFFQVADAMVYPDSGNVTILHKAKMKTLDNAKIVANYVSQYHHIYKANLNVTSKNFFSGTGYIDYLENGAKKEPIFLEKIAVDTTGQTYASGAIVPKDSFKLGAQFAYYGKVNMKSNDQSLTFTGFTKLKQNCKLMPSNWISFTAPIDPKKIYIPIDSNTVDMQGTRLVSSIMLNDTAGIYTAFATPAKRKTDAVVLPSYGYIFYDKPNQQYEIANKLKIIDQSYPGQYLALSTKDCKVIGEGKINMGLDMGRVQITSAGKIIHNQVDNQAILDLVMGVNFYFPDKAIAIITDAIEKKTSLLPLNYNRDNYKMALQALVGKEDADKMISQIALNGKAKKIPKPLRNTFVFSDLKMRWNQKTHSYRSFGKIGISNIGKTQVSKYVTGDVEIREKRGYNIINIYLELDPNHWYFFSYQRGVMQSISSNKDYNTILIQTKAADRKAPNKKGLSPYQFMYSSIREKQDFIRSFESK